MARDGLKIPADESEADRLEKRIRAVRYDIERLEKKFSHCEGAYAKAQAEADNLTREANLTPNPAESLIEMVKSANQAALRAVHAKNRAEKNLADKRTELGDLELAKKRRWASDLPQRAR